MLGLEPLGPIQPLDCVDDKTGARDETRLGRGGSAGTGRSPATPPPACLPPRRAAVSRLCGDSPADAARVSQLSVSIAWKVPSCPLAAPILAARSLKLKRANETRELGGPESERRQMRTHTHTHTHTHTRGHLHTQHSAPASAQASAAPTRGRADQGTRALSLSRPCPAAQRPGDGWNFILGARAPSPPE